MRAAIMRNKKLIVDQMPVPTLGPGEVLVKTLACGICGSDLHALKFADKMVDAVKRSGGGIKCDAIHRNACEVVAVNQSCAAAKVNPIGKMGATL